MIIHEIVHSPDDGGYWISQVDVRDNVVDGRSRASVKIYSSRAEAEQAIANRKVRYEKWT